MCLRVWRRGGLHAPAIRPPAGHRGSGCAAVGWLRLQQAAGFHCRLRLPRRLHLQALLLALAATLPDLHSPPGLPQPPPQTHSTPLPPLSLRRCPLLPLRAQTGVLTVRMLINNMRDIAVFGLRLGMFMMLCICIGTIYFDLGSSWEETYSRAALLFFTVAFLTFMSSE